MTPPACIFCTLDREILAESTHALAFADASPEPEAGEAYDHVFVDPLISLRRGPRAPAQTPATHGGSN